MKIMTVITLLHGYFFTALHFDAQASEKNTLSVHIHQNSHEDYLELDKLPPYEHKNFALQRAQYDQLYKAVEPSRKNFETLHIDGLFLILTRGFSIVQDYIRTHPEDQKNEGPASLEKLSYLFKKASRLNVEKKLSQADFLRINIILALIVDEHKGMECLSDTKKTWKNLMSEKTGAWEDFGGKNAKEWPETGVVKIIYSNPNPLELKKPIGYEAFISEALNDKYKGCLLFFDVHSIDPSESNEPFSKKSPHYGYFNGTYKMLMHDLAHQVEQAKIEHTLIEEGYSEEGYYNNSHKKSYKLDKVDKKIYKAEINLKDKLHQMKKIRGNLTDPNKKTLLTNALFILSHELTNVTKISNHSSDFIKAIYKYKDKDSDKVNFYNLLQYVQYLMIEHTKNPRHLKLRDPKLSNPNIRMQYYYYQINQRDQERILKMRNKQNELVSLEDDSGPLLRTEDNKDLLPDLFKKLTDKEKQSAVAKGYERFWDYCIKILKENGFQP